MSAPRFWGGPYGTTTTSSAAASSGPPTNLGGPISVPAWDQFSTASSSGLSPQEYAALNRMPMKSSQPEVREWPKFLRVRVSGDLNYTGNAAERSAGCIPLDYRPAPEVEAIPGPTAVGEKYLLVCERSLQLEREWAEAKLIVEGEYPTPPSYVNARVVPMQSLQVASVQTEPEVPSAMEVGTLTSDLELAHAKHSVMARIGTIALSTGIEVWMLQNFIRSLRGGIDALPKMHEARLLMECINMSQRYKETPQFRLETLSNRLVGRNRGGVQHLCCFEQYRLSGFIWGWSDQTTFIYPSIATCASSTTTAYFGSRGTGSWPGATIGCCCYHYYGAGDYVSPRQCLGDRTAEVYWLAYATAAGGGAFTLSGPGVSSACGGIVFERTNRAVFVAHIAPERANEVVYNPWIGCTGVVREAYQFVASQDSRTSAVIPHPANGGWWKIRNPELDWFLGGARFELWNLKDKTPKRLRPNRGGTSLFLPRQKNWWCHMDSWLVSGSSWLVSGSSWLVSGSSWLVTGSSWLVSGSSWLVSGSTWLVSGSAWSVTGSRSCGSGRLCRAWSELCVFCLAECRMACMFCWLSMKLQFCMSGSSHCDELPRSVLRKLSSLEPGRELFGVAVWILEDLSGRCWMLACSVLRLLCKRRRSPRRRRKSRLLGRFRTLPVRCMRHVVNDDTRRGVIKRSELRAWTELNQRRAENSDFLRFRSGEASVLQRGAVNHVLAGLPSGAPRRE